MEHIAISVIVPVYNTKPFLRECVQSILDQKETFPENYEVILVDDGATAVSVVQDDVCVVYNESVARGVAAKITSCRAIENGGKDGP